MPLFGSKEDKVLDKATSSLLKAAGLGKDTKVTRGLSTDGDFIIRFTDKRPLTRAAHREGDQLEATLELAGIDNLNKPRIIPGTEDENGRPDKTPSAILQHVDGRAIKTLRIDTEAQGGIASLSQKLNDIAGGLASPSTSFQDKLRAERANAEHKGAAR